MSITREEIDRQLQELKDKGVHHASKEFKELKETLEAQLTGGTATTLPKQTKNKEEAQQEDMDFDPNVNYTFRLNRREKLRIIPREATVWDEELQKPRKIRYVKTEDSPYVEEQDELSVADRNPIMFKDGIKVVSGSDKAMIKYLLAYDGNQGKKKTLPQNRTIKGLYSLFDPTAKARAERLLEETRHKARGVVHDASFEQLSAYIRSTYGVVVKTEDEAKSYVYGKISTIPNNGKKSAAELILTDFNNPKHALKAAIQMALQKGAIKLEGDKITTGSTGALIVRYDSKDTKTRYDEVLASHILKGGEDAESIKALIYK
jgi:hypothetical protein